MNKLISNIGFITAFVIIAVAGILIPKGVYFLVGNLLEVIPRDDFFLYYHNLKFLIPLTGIFIYFFFRQFNYKSQPFKFGLYDVWFIAFTGWVFISGLWAKNPIVTVSVGFGWIFLYSIFKFFEDFCFTDKRKNIIIYFLLIVLVLSLIPIFSFFLITGYSPSSGQLSFSSNQLLNIWSMFFTHRNYCSSIIVLLSALPLYWLYKSKNWYQSALAVFLVCTIFLSLLLLRSRGSLLAFFTISSVVLIYNFWSKTFSWKVLLAFVFIFAALFKVVVALQFDQSFYLLLLDPLAGVNSLDGDDRLELWQMSWQLFKENPIIGYGAGNWQFEYMKYGAGDLKFTSYIDKYLGHPHNFFVDVLFSNGLIGFVLMFIFMVKYFIVVGIKKFFTKNFTKIDFVCFAGIAGYWVVAQFYGTVYMAVGNFVGHVVLFFVFVGCLQLKKASIKNFVLPFFIICLCIGTIFFHLNSIAMLRNYDLYKEAKRNGKYMLCKYIIQKLEENSIGFMGYNYVTISTDELWYDLYKRIGKSEENLVYIQKILNKDPYNFNHWHTLANTLSNLDRQSEAIECYEKVLLYNCDFIPAKIKLLKLYEKYNITEKANQLWNDLHEIDAYLELYSQYENRWKHFSTAVEKKEDFLFFKNQLNYISLYCDY